MFAARPDPGFEKVAEPDGGGRGGQADAHHDGRAGPPATCGRRPLLPGRGQFGRNTVGELGRSAGERGRSLSGARIRASPVRIGVALLLGPPMTTT